MSCVLIETGADLAYAKACYLATERSVVRTPSPQAVMSYVHPNRARSFSVDLTRFDPEGIIGSMTNLSAFSQVKCPPNADDWPLESHLALGAMKSAVPSARLHARLIVIEWGMAAIARTVELIVSELMTNAVAASGDLATSPHFGKVGLRNSSVGLWLRSNSQKVLAQVWDGNQSRPQEREPGLEEESGRGLLLVEAHSADWGSYVPEGWTGKIVWALIEPA